MALALRAAALRQAAAPVCAPRCGALACSAQLAPPCSASRTPRFKPAAGGRRTRFRVAASDVRSVARRRSAAAHVTTTRPANSCALRAARTAEASGGLGAAGGAAIPSSALASAAASTAAAPAAAGAQRHERHHESGWCAVARRAATPRLAYADSAHPRQPPPLLCFCSSPRASSRPTAPDSGRRCSRCLTATVQPAVRAKAAAAADDLAR